MNIKQQIALGVLVCPKTKQKLLSTKDGKWLENESRSERYQLLKQTTPVLLADPTWAHEYAAESDVMTLQYSDNYVKSKITTLIQKIKANDYRTKSSKQAFLEVFRTVDYDSVCVSVGGGPRRAHHLLTNINIGPFPNVDVVADAHQLPYADNSVDVLYCDAVLEHLHTPVLAAQEMFRVLKKGARAYVCTPFMQAYHGYPHHYQNFTLTGHTHLLASVGFRVVEAGVCVGPIYTMANMFGTFLIFYLPSPLNKLLKSIWNVIFLIIRPIDKLLEKNKNSHVLASTTYAVVEKI